LTFSCAPRRNPCGTHGDACWPSGACSVWAECPTELDTPVLVFGYEVEDLGAICGVMILSGLFLFEGFMGVLLTTVAFAFFLKRLKKGKAPGMLIHLAHRWDLIRMPGVLPVREVGYSPVAADARED